VLEGLKARIRPGSKGESTSKVDTTGRGMASQAAELRGREGPMEATTGVNWPVGLMTYQEGHTEGVSEARPIRRHAPDDSQVLNKLFRLDVEDI
jgi:hypothetical protein